MPGQRPCMSFGAGHDKTPSRLAIRPGSMTPHLTGTISASENDRNPGVRSPKIPVPLHLYCGTREDSVEAGIWFDEDLALPDVAENPVTKSPGTPELPAEYFAETYRRSKMKVL